MNFQLIGITPETLSDSQWATVPDLFTAGLSYLYVRQPDTEVLRKRLTSNELQSYQSRLLVPIAKRSGCVRVDRTRFSTNDLTTNRGVGLRVTYPHVREQPADKYQFTLHRCR